MNYFLFNWFSPPYHRSMNQSGSTDAFLNTALSRFFPVVIQDFQKFHYYQAIYYSNLARIDLYFNL